MMQHSQSTGNPQSQQSKRKIHDWLMDEGWQVGEDHSPETAWILTASDTGGRRIIVGQRNDRADMVIIEAGIVTGDNVKRFLATMDKHARNEFYFDLRYALLQMGVEYTNIQDPFERIRVNQRIYAEALIRDAFIQRVILVRNAQIMVLLKIAFLMNEPPIIQVEQPPIGFHPPEK